MSVRERRASQFELPLDRLLLALRATGPDSYRADPENPGRWHASCPSCPPVDARRLVIDERPGRSVRFSCRLGCATQGIMAALADAERSYDTASSGWGAWSPAVDQRVAQIELDLLRAAKRIAWVLRQESA